MQAGFFAFAQAVGVAAEGDDGGLVEEPVEGGGGHDGIADDDLAHSAKALLEVRTMAPPVS